jgi:hypothetical protein
MELIGVYKLAVSDELTAEQAEILYGDTPSASEVATVRAQLDSVVLVEVLVRRVDDRFDVSDFQQVDPTQPPENAQAPWAEVFLSADGSDPLAEPTEEPVAGHKDFRIAFFLHGWLVGVPLSTSYNPLAWREPADMPERLRSLVPYPPVD